MSGCYKIKLRAAGYRLAYEVVDQLLIVAVVKVVAAGKQGKDKNCRSVVSRIG